MQNEEIECEPGVLFWELMLLPKVFGVIIGLAHVLRGQGQFVERHNEKIRRLLTYLGTPIFPVGAPSQI